MGSMGIEPFETTFAVPMHCDSCVQSVSSALNKLDGIASVEANLKDQLVLVKGTAAPSTIVTTIQSTGRDAILRGSGHSNTAGVCILETHADVPDPVRGLARMVQIKKDMTLVDLTIQGLAAGQYQVTIREFGNISEGAASTGGVWEAVKAASGLTSSPTQSRGIFGAVEVGKDGRGSVFIHKLFSIWEVIGRSMVVSKQAGTQLRKDDPDTVVGVIARSAGVWDNDKVVCSCSGKNVWQERKEQVSKGMI